MATTYEVIFYRPLCEVIGTCERVEPSLIQIGREPQAGEDYLVRLIQQEDKKGWSNTKGTQCLTITEDMILAYLNMANSCPTKAIRVYKVESDNNSGKKHRTWLQPESYLREILAYEAAKHRG